MGERKVTIISYDCPGCGVSLQIDPETKSTTCEYCGMHFSVESQKMVPPTRARSTSGNGLANNPKALTALIVGIVLTVALIIMPFILGGIYSVTRVAKTVNTEMADKEADPFKDIEIRLDGMGPYAKVVDVTNNTDIRGIQYKLDKKSGLSNGDVITIEAEKLPGYIWTDSTYEYTVSGLNSIVTDLAQLSEDDKELLIQEAQKEVEKAWETNLSDSGITEEDINLNIQPYKIYINVCKNEEYVFYSSNNAVYPAFETTFSYDGKEYTVYQYAEITNVYKMPSGSMHGDFDRMHAANGYIYSRELGIDEYFSVWGFESKVKMESNMEEENFDLIK